MNCVRITNNKLKQLAEDFLGGYQNGFRPGRVRVNEIYILQQIIEKT